MDNNDIYRTILKPSEGLYKEKGSKFIAYAIPVTSEEQIKEELQNIRKIHFDARHICYAWRLGYNKLNYRANDDGEPSGTAGKPILGQIDSFGVTEVLIAVVRYFGGILLGTGGLVVAYKQASIDALSNAEIIENTIREVFLVSYPYEATPEIQQIIKTFRAELSQSEYDTECRAFFHIPKSLSGEFEERINKSTEINIKRSSF